VDLRYLNAERLKIPIAIAAGLAVGVALAVAVGSGEFGTLRRVFLFGVFLSVMLFGQHHAWRAALAVCLIDFFYLGLGFSMWNTEQTGILAVLIILVTWWRKERIRRPAIMETMVFGVFNLALLGWLIYVFAHSVYNVMDPYNPVEFAFKNFIKVVVQFTGPLLLLFYFMHRPTGIVVDKRVLVHITAIGLLAVTINLGTRFWEISTGALEPGNQIEGETPYFSIPSLEIMANYYALRNLTPVLGVFCIVLLNGKWFVRQSFLVRGGIWALYFLSFLGAVLSGGRATVIFLFALSLGVLWLRHYYQLVFGLVGAAMVFVLALNLVPNVLEPLPMIVQRSLQSVVFTTESVQAKASIDSSSEWRIELVKRALDQWRGDSRVFWFGRGTYKFGADDYRAMKRDAGSGAMEVALRRGATHSLVSDLLLVFGLVGFVIYMTMNITLLMVLWRLWKNPETDEIARSLTLVCFVFGGFSLVYGIVGGGSVPLALAWLLVVLFGYLYRMEAQKETPPPKVLVPIVSRIGAPRVRASGRREPLTLARARRFTRS
jgi:hypothetical protein